jgi:hypothetical protein
MNESQMESRQDFVDEHKREETEIIERLGMQISVLEGIISDFINKKMPKKQLEAKYSTYCAMRNIQ